MGLSELIQRYQNTNGNTKNTKEMLGVPAGAPVFTDWNTKNTKNTTKVREANENTDLPPEPHQEELDRPKASSAYWTAAIASAEWLQARDAFYNHIFSCSECYAPIRRYCSTGQTLRQNYQEARHERQHSRV